jgi:hypothetical protein
VSELQLRQVSLPRNCIRSLRRVGQGLTAFEPEALETNLRTRRCYLVWLLVGVGLGRLPVARACPWRGLAACGA